MMGQLLWFRMNVDIMRNPKVIALVNQPRGTDSLYVYLSMLCYCAEWNTGGVISKGTARLIHHANTRTLSLLSDTQFILDETDYYRIHDWDEYQPGIDAARRLTERGKAGAAARWNGHRNGNKR